MPNAYCCNGTTSVTVLDGATAAVLTTITMAVASHYAFVSPDGTRVAVSQQSGQSVQFITVATGAVGTRFTTTITNPLFMAWAWDSSKVYVYGMGASSVSQVQTLTPAGTLGSVWTVGPTGTLAGGGMCLDGAGAKLYCVCWATANTVKQVDTTSGAVTASYPIPTASTVLGGEVVMAMDGTKLYVSNAHATTPLVYPIPIATGVVGAGLAVGNTPVGLCASPDGSTIWSASQSAGQVRTIATSSFTVTHTITAPSATEIVITPDGAHVLVGGRAGNQVIPITVSTFTAGTGTALSGAGAANGIGIVPTPPAPTPPPVVTSGAVVFALGPVVLDVGGGGKPPPIIISTTVTGTAVLNIGPLSVTIVVTVETDVGAVAVHLGPLLLAAIGGRIGPGAWPVPGYRSRWRLTLHNRAFAPATLGSTMIAELADARGRRLEQAWNTPATLTFTLDGHSQAAGLIQELLHDVVAWRWDDQTGQDFAVFRGPITQSEDQLTTESHTVTYICHDYAAMLSRRILTATYTVTGRDQDLVVGDLLGLASSAATSSGTSLSPASFLPVALLACNPNGTLRGLSTQLRDRTYYGSENVGTAVDDLAKVINGFDYDVVPSAVDDHDSLRVFYPQQGVTRTGIALQYGSTVATLTRSVNSADYANYVRVLGNNSSANPTPQLYAEAWTADAHAITPTPVGLWMLDDNAAAVTVQAALNDKAAGDLNLDAILVPAYTLGLAPDAYTWGNPNMGDVVPLIVNSGRLNVNSTVRVLGIGYDIGDDGQEDVVLTVSRPQSTLAKLFRKTDRNVKALDRR